VGPGSEAEPESGPEAGERMREREREREGERAMGQGRTGMRMFACKGEAPL